MHDQYDTVATFTYRISYFLLKGETAEQSENYEEAEYYYNQAIELNKIKNKGQQFHDYRPFIAIGDLYSKTGRNASNHYNIAINIISKQMPHDSRNLLLCSLFEKMALICNNMNEKYPSYVCKWAARN